VFVDDCVLSAASSQESTQLNSITRGCACKGESTEKLYSDLYVELPQVSKDISESTVNDIMTLKTIEYFKLAKFYLYTEITYK
jgi:hypothetical protein